MPEHQATKSNNVIMQNKVFAWLALATGLILLVPLIAMQFTDEVAWTFADFAIAGVFIFGAGSIFVLLARKMRKHRLAIGAVLLVVLIWLWVELAVGLFTNWGS